MREPQADDDRWMTKSMVAREVMCTRRTIDRWRIEQSFPEPDVRVNRRRYWLARTVRMWKAERMAEAQSSR